MAKAKTTATSASTPTKKTYDHRTAEGREAYAADVLSAIKGAGTNGALGKEILEKVGGTQTQFRAAVKLLGDKVAKSGATSYTRYAAA